MEYLSISHTILHRSLSFSFDPHFSIFLSTSFSGLGTCETLRTLYTIDRIGIKVFFLKYAVVKQILGDFNYMRKLPFNDVLLYSQLLHLLGAQGCCLYYPLSTYLDKTIWVYIIVQYKNTVFGLIVVKSVKDCVLKTSSHITFFVVYFMVRNNFFLEIKSVLFMGQHLLPIVISRCHQILVTFISSNGFYSA